MGKLAEPQLRAGIHHGSWSGFRSTSLFLRWKLLQERSPRRNSRPTIVLHGGTFTIEPLARIASAITFEGASKRERGICISVEIPEPGSHSRPRDSCVTVKPRGKLCLPTFLSAATKLLASIVAKRYCWIGLG